MSPPHISDPQYALIRDPHPEALASLDALSFLHPWSAQEFSRLLANQAMGAWLLRASGQDVAYLCFQSTGDEGEIHRIAVIPSERRKGLARLLLKAFRAWMLEQGASRILLEVRAGNQAALRLYSELGYTLLTRRRDYYLDPVEDALVMETNLTRD